MSQETSLLFPYTYTDVHRVCCRINGLVPSFTFSGHRVAPMLAFTREFSASRATPTMHEKYFVMDLCLTGNAYVTGYATQVTPGTVVYHEAGDDYPWRAALNTCMTLYLWASITPPLRIGEPKRWPVFPWALHDFALIIEESRGNQHGWAERAGWRLAILLSRVLAQAADVQKPHSPPSYVHEILPRAVETYLASHYAFPITIDEVAAAVQVSRRTLTREYRRRTGITVMERLTQLRMEHASFCLCETVLPLADIAVQCGIPDRNYFCRLFRRHFSLSPLQYRKEAGGQATGDDAASL